LLKGFPVERALLESAGEPFPAACRGVSEQGRMVVPLKDRRFSAVCCGELQFFGWPQPL